MSWSERVAGLLAATTSKVAAGAGLAAEYNRLEQEGPAPGQPWQQHEVSQILNLIFLHGMIWRGPFFAK